MTTRNITISYFCAPQRQLQIEWYVCLYKAEVLRATLPRPHSWAGIHCGLPLPFHSLHLGWGCDWGKNKQNLYSKYLLSSSFPDQSDPRSSYLPSAVLPEQLFPFLHRSDPVGSSTARHVSEKSTSLGSCLAGSLGSLSCLSTYDLPVIILTFLSRLALFLFSNFQILARTWDAI